MKKNRLAFRLLLFVVLLLPSCRENPPQYSHLALDWEALSDKLVERMNLQSGERVFLLARPGDFDPLIPLLRKKIAALGAEDLGAISVTKNEPESWKSGFTAVAKGKDREALGDYFRDVDLAVMLPGPTPADLAYAAMQDVLKRGNGRTIHFHWSGAYDFHSESLPITPKVNAFYQRAILQTDYQKLKESQLEFELALRGKTVQVTTPRGTDLRFQIGNRPVTKQDGDASALRASQAKNLIDREVELPAGAVRVAPVEETVEGNIAFPDAEWNGQAVAGLLMTFKQGKVTDWKADKGAEAVEAVIRQAGEAARSFREFALGMNPLLAIPSEDPPWIPYYGYGAGVVRLSLGDNIELGGKVSGGFVRWNFFPDATVKVGTETWVKDGKLLKF